MSGLLKRDEESRPAVVPQRAGALLPSLMRVAKRVVEKAVKSEDQQHHSSGQLEVEFIHGIIDEVEHKAQADTRYQSVYKIADSGPNPVTNPYQRPSSACAAHR